MIDTDWFLAQLTERRMSQRRLAGFMGIDPASVHRLLQGKRPMRFDEATQLAQLLGVTVDDVLRHAGLPIGAGGDVPVVGTIEAGGEAHIDWGAEIGRAAAPLDMPANTVAVRMRTAGTPWEPMDGWTLYLRPPVDGVPADVVGRMALVRMAGAGTILLRFLRRGYTRGRYNLVGWQAASIEDAALDWATAVDHIAT